MKRQHMTKKAEGEFALVLYKSWFIFNLILSSIYQHLIETRGTEGSKIKKCHLIPYFDYQILLYLNIMIYNVWSY